MEENQIITKTSERDLFNKILRRSGDEKQNHLDESVDNENHGVPKEEINVEELKNKIDELRQLVDEMEQRNRVLSEEFSSKDSSGRYFGFRDLDEVREYKKRVDLLLRDLENAVEVKNELNTILGVLKNNEQEKIHQNVSDTLERKLNGVGEVIKLLIDMYKNRQKCLIDVVQIKEDSEASILTQLFQIYVDCNGKWELFEKISRDVLNTIKILPKDQEYYLASVRGRVKSGKNLN